MEDAQKIANAIKPPRGDKLIKKNNLGRRLISR